MSILLKDVTSSPQTVTLGRPITLYIKASRTLEAGKLSKRVTISCMPSSCTPSVGHCDITIPVGSADTVEPVTVTITGPGNLAMVTVLVTLDNQVQRCVLSVARGSI